MRFMRKIVVAGVASAALAGGVSAVVAVAAAPTAVAANQGSSPASRAWNGWAWNGWEWNTVLAGWAWNGPVVTNPTAVEYGDGHVGIY
jgi:hypothetical protein